MSLFFKKCCFFVGLIASITITVDSHAISLSGNPKLQAIANELVEQGLYTQAELRVVFNKAQVQDSVLNAMKNPAEYKLTWGKYRNIFMKEDRYQNGADFWTEHQAAFDRAEREYGVPAEIIAAIIGVESKFGRYKGKHKVLDSLVSLVVGYPRRSAFFAKELKAFLILTKENQLMSDQILGSYAGAVGYPQFISSSYRNYAVDFSGDGKTDLINQPVDAIGSVANYFVKNGWLTGQPVTSREFQNVPKAISDKASRKRKVLYSADSLRNSGASIPASIQGQEKLSVLMLNASKIVDDVKETGIYVVRAGDTACQIAEKYNSSCAALFKKNRLNKKGHIFRGQRLKVPNQSGIRQSKSNNTVMPRYFYTHENFYVITRYNHSVLYAMAVYQLSQAIAQAKANR